MAEHNEHQERGTTVRDAAHDDALRHDLGVDGQGHRDTARDGHADAADHDAHAGHGQADQAHAGHDHHGHGAGGHDHHGHGGHGDHAAMFRDKFWWSLVLAVPVVAFSSMFADILHYPLPDAAWAGWVSPVLGTVLFLYGGWPFLSGGVSEARAKQPGMMLLIGMAIVVAFVASWITSLGLFGLDLDFWWELALLIVIMLLGHWIEMRAMGVASSALDALAALLPDEADVIDDRGEVSRVAVSSLQVGQTVVVRPGGRVPADGTVVDGRAQVDESMITGESVAVERGSGDRVVAGTVATDSSIRVRITATGDDTALSGIQRMVAEAQSSSSRTQVLADRAAALLFFFATGAAIITFVVWILLGSPTEAITRTVTVLIIACPHALGLAIPLVVAISTERAAKAGILVKDRLALERMRNVDTVVFDKTGTLTTGSPEVVDTVGDDAVLGLAAAAERDSEHPVARAIVAAADQRGVAVPSEVAETGSVPGRGVTATIAGQRVEVGGPAMLRERGAAVPAEFEDTLARWRAEGAAVIVAVVDGTVRAAFAVRDAVRPESAEAVRALHDRGVRVAMVTGDAQQVADAVARELGIDEVRAEVLPEDKDAEVARLQQGGAVVAMVGDGVNDAPALARADVGIAIGAGTDVAVQSAGVVLASNDPRRVLTVIDLSRATYRKMVQNLVWATGYNLLSVPLAAGVLAGVGFVLSPAVGAVLMSLSTVIVSLNAQLLRRFRA
ncbi:heavy metal translocating P-type ATPase [Curtobacterium sp. MCLR17_007]|uniref:heavy metal translocating P-type ATPase n=1 Tax=Curtobacterium sp. MCLR17_007 TaxID=2175648 RepID=UPI000DA9023A|nr:heavy metal translocating P-type ATPase [Curtobacterium sp. MCLR17_007]WIB59298.1 heavy metal translocating P-type ATPase [Curtobacterium sp. MCLR17_007]